MRPFGETRQTASLPYLFRGESENDRSRASVINNHTVTGRGVRLGAAGERPGGAAGSALRRGVLLQGEMGLRRRIHPTLQEEPPAGLEETDRGRAHRERQDRKTTLSFYRRRALGLSSHYRLQKRRRLPRPERPGRRRGDRQTTLPRAGQIQARRATAIRDTDRPLGHAHRSGGVNMRILTLNLNGIRSATAKGLVSWLAASGADVVCLQEVRAFPEQAPPEWRDLGYHMEWYPAERPGYSGVALLSKTKPKRVTRGMKSAFDGEARVLQADFGDFSVVSTYIPSGTSSPERLAIKLKFMDEFLLHCRRLRRSKRELVFCGDFNIAH